MTGTMWTNISFRLCVIWINLFILITVLLFHSYRLCYLQKDRKGSSIRLFKFISFKHLSFIVIIASILPPLQQAIIYTPQHVIADKMCKFTIIFGIIFLSFAKLALHLFVTVRSQVSRNDTTSIWFKIGLIMIISDVLYILYVLSGIPTIISIQNGILCTPILISLPVYIWFAMNDFVIGCYCLLAFIIPLRKYVVLEEEDKEESTVTQDAELRPLIARIMIYSSIALISTMIITIVSSMVNESGGVLFGIDSVINSICVALQFCSTNNNGSNGFTLCSWMESRRKSDNVLETVSPGTNVSTPQTYTNNNISMVIHSMPKTKPQLKDNVSLSVSLVVQNEEDIADFQKEEQI